MILRPVCVRCADPPRGRMREKGCELPGLVPCSPAAPHAQLIQMSTPVMAQQTVHVRDAQKGLRDIRHLLVHDVLYRAAGHHATH